VTGPVKVKVFKTDGTFEKEVLLNMTGTGPYETESFSLSAGTKYIYVFFNDAARADIVVGTGKTRTQFEQNAYDVSFNSSSLPDIAENNSFALGTLYGEAKVVEGGGTVASPKTLALSVGRAVAKVNLKAVSDVAGGEMLGNFENPTYRIGSMAKKVFTVGQFTLASDAPAGTMPPAAGGKWTAFSAVHNEPPVTGANAYNSAAFLDYAALWRSPNDVFYVTENTTAEDGSGYLYFGNTSYVQVRTKYVPDPAEVRDPEDLSQTVTIPSNGDFWTVAQRNGTRLIVGVDPATIATGDLDPEIDQTKAYYKYATGLNYHKFAIRDSDPTLGSSTQMYCVLRNTYYEYTVTDFTTLGSYTDIVDPTEPVPTKTELKLTVTVKPWAKITENLTL
jgi:hypothetical protein